MNEELMNIILFVVFNEKIPTGQKISLVTKINEIIRFYYKPELEIQKNIQLELIREVCNSYIKYNDVDCIITNINLIEKFKDYYYILKNIKESSKNVTNEQIEQYIELINTQMKYVLLKKEASGLKSFIEKLDSDDFTNVDYLVNNYESLVKELFINMIQGGADVSLSNFIDFSDSQKNDELVDSLKIFYDKKNLLSTGYQSMDRILEGGFEKTRLYLFAGQPGSGKSTLLLNFLINQSKMYNNKDDDNLFLYVTMENILFETIMRMISINRQMSVIDIKEKLYQDSQWFKNEMCCFSNNTVILYYPPNTISSADLMVAIESIETHTGKKVKILYVDYLDLMLPTKTIDVERFALTRITLDLKSIASKYEIPVITLSQLVKSAYGNVPGMGSVKESSGKAEGADVLSLLYRDINTGTLACIFDKCRYTKTGTIYLSLSNNSFYIGEIDDPTIMKNTNMNININNNGNGFQNQKPSMNFSFSTLKIEDEISDTYFN